MASGSIKYCWSMAFISIGRRYGGTIMVTVCIVFDVHVMCVSFEMGADGDARNRGGKGGIQFTPKALG